MSARALYAVFIVLYCGDYVVYTQPPSLALAEIEALLQEAKMCQFASFYKDGPIHLVSIWCNYENGNVYIATPEASQKALNVKRNSARMY